MSWCFGRFEEWIARVSGSMWYAKVVLNGYKSWFYQIQEFSHFCKLSCFWSKRWEVTKARPVLASSNPAYIWWAWPQVCGFCLLSKIWFKAQGMQFDIKQVLTKMAMLPFCYFWINPLCKPLMIRTKLQSIEFAFNSWVWEGLDTCKQV